METHHPHEDAITAACTVDDMIRLHNKCNSDLDFLAYPRVDGDLSSYEFYNSARLNQTIDKAVTCLLQSGASPQNQPFETVAGVIAPSGLELLVSACALSRLGYTVLIFSTRLGPAVQSHIISIVNCELLFLGSSAYGSSHLLQESSEPGCTIAQLPSRASWKATTAQPPLEEHFAKRKDYLRKTAFIHCSSGSTGLPKPIFTTHKRYINELTRTSLRHSTFGTIPLFQASGFAGFWKAVACQKVLVLPDATVPLTAESVVETLRVTQPGSMLAVPYTLKLLAECPESWPLLRALKQVTFGGCPCPDEVGDALVAQGVNLIAFLGSTEAGGLATSVRPPGDPTWNYLRFLPSVKPFVYMKPLSPGDPSANIFELVLLDGLESKTISNSNDPPNSLHTRDLFRRHPDLDAWYYLGRQDDRITLAKGEKLLPLPMEAALMDSPLVRQALMFGDGREFPGVLVFRSARAAALDDEAFLEAVWPLVKSVNEEAESFAQVSRAMVVVLPAEREFPRTDKSTIIRGQTYAVFAREIDAAYEAWLSADAGSKVDICSIEDMRQWLLDACRHELGMSRCDLHESLFVGGLDSLKASQLVALIRRGISVHGENVRTISIQQIYQCGNLDQLAECLWHPTGFDLTGSSKSGHAELESLIDRFGTFDSKIGPEKRPVLGEKTLLLTGATGSLGSHILAQALSPSSDYSRIICLVRKHGDDPAKRVFSQLQAQKLSTAPEHIDKLTILPADLAAPKLGLDPKSQATVQSSVTHIIHAGWTVNFNLPLSTFATNDLLGLHNLLSLSLQTAHNCTLAFTSSISVAAVSAAARSAGTPVPERLITNFDDCSQTGYARSKLVAEYTVANARENYGADAFVIRIGQIVGSFDGGRWNQDELVPLMVRSALHTKTMPLLPEDLVSWLPVDICARVTLEILSSGLAGAGAEATAVFNVTNPTWVSWSAEFLPALNAAGMEATGVTMRAWVARLQEYADTHEGAAEINPAVRLLDFWKRLYATDVGDEKKTAPSELVFDTTQAQMASTTLANLSRNGTGNLVKEGYVVRFVEEWKKSW